MSKITHKRVYAAKPVRATSKNLVEGALVRLDNHREAAILNGEFVRPRTQVAPDGEFEGTKATHVLGHVEPVTVTAKQFVAERIAAKQPAPKAKKVTRKRTPAATKGKTTPKATTTRARSRVAPKGMTIDEQIEALLSEARTLSAQRDAA